MEVYEIAKLLEQTVDIDQRYFEFLRHPSLSVGIYRLPAGASDEQSAHTEDEVYFVLSGSAVFRSGTRRKEVRSGSVIFVASNVEHKFEQIYEDITVLVFFAPAEYALSGRA